MKTTKINWKKYRDSAMYVNVIDLADEVVEKIISENVEYLTWSNGSEIAKDELRSDFILVKMEDGTYSLTMKDEDFYVNDIMYDEKDV